MLDAGNNMSSKVFGSARTQASVDGSNLNDLKRLAREDPKQAVRAAARQFEVVFMQMLLKSMRDTEMKSGLMESESTGMYQSLLDTQLAQKLSGGKGNGQGLGLADMIERQMMRQMDAIKPGEIRNQNKPIPLLPPQQSTLERLRQATREAAAAGNNMGVPASTAANGMTTSDSVSAGPRQFVQKMWSSAKAAEQSTGIPAQFMLGQAALESGWGKREITHADGSPSHNLFGIKAGANWHGKVVAATTTEYVNGVARKTVERFRAYDSYTESFQDYAQLMRNNPRYAGVLRDAANAGNAQTFAQNLQRAGYATDPQYADKLGKTIAATLRIIA